MPVPERILSSRRHRVTGVMSGVVKLIEPSRGKLVVVYYARAECRSLLPAHGEAILDGSPVHLVKGVFV